MIILEKYKLLEKLIGLNPSGRIENIILRTVYLVILMTFNLMELIYIVVHFREGIDRAAPALAPFSGVFPALANYIYLVMDRQRYYSLLTEMQDFVNESTKSLNDFVAEQIIDIDIQFLGMGNVESRIIYKQAEQRMNFATRIVVCAQIVFPVMSFSPSILAACHWFLGKYTIDSWFHYFPVW